MGGYHKFLCLLVLEGPLDYTFDIYFHYFTPNVHKFHSIREEKVHDAFLNSVSHLGAFLEGISLFCITTLDYPMTRRGGRSRADVISMPFIRARHSARLLDFSPIPRNKT